MKLTPAQTIAMSTFRRSSHAAHVKAVLQDELAQRRTVYSADNSDITGALLARAAAVELRDTITILFEEPI